ncbi:MAG: ABC transporter [Chloroflexi bacterium RBG_16_54_18]|nr:MAG: ABC transporter [Chloroflexi bacterium RBG_16_54_18]
MTHLEVKNLSKSYNRQEMPAVSDVSFRLAGSEILALVGPSGCGKTTTLRLIAGLEVPDTGTITLGERVLVGRGEFIPAEKRGVGMVFQEHALFPHLTVYDNVAFGLHRLAKAQKRETVNDFLSLVGLEALAGRYPHALSGGERQRAALARALAPQPEVLLMDEPFSSLDADLRTQVREQVRGILKSIRATAIFVTHDQEEALFMGDRLAVFQGGSIEQIGKPEEVYHESKTRFVAEFMGSSDFVSGINRADGVHTPLGILPPAEGFQPDGKVEVAMRADDVDFTLHGTGNGCIEERFFRGAFYIYRLRLDSGEILHALKAHTVWLPVGQRVRVFISADHPLAVFQKGYPARW